MLKALPAITDIMRVTGESLSTSITRTLNHSVDNVPIFFSIYYCMTGLHAIHIIGGIIALGWVYWRCILGHWRNDYFGPVDYVGLYWHLVDLIWIYLFPLLYLID